MRLLGAGALGWVREEGKERSAAGGARTLEPNKLERGSVSPNESHFFHHHDKDRGEGGIDATLSPDCSCNRHHGFTRRQGWIARFSPSLSFASYIMPTRSRFHRGIFR